MGTCEFIKGSKGVVDGLGSCTLNMLHLENLKGDPLSLAKYLSYVLILNMFYFLSGFSV